MNHSYSSSQSMNHSPEIGKQKQIRRNLSSVLLTEDYEYLMSLGYSDIRMEKLSRYITQHVFYYKRELGKYFFINKKYPEGRATSLQSFLKLFEKFDPDVQIIDASDFIPKTEKKIKKDNESSDTESDLVSEYKETEYNWEAFNEPVPKQTRRRIVNPEKKTKAIRKPTKAKALDINDDDFIDNFVMPPRRTLADMLADIDDILPGEKQKRKRQSKKHEFKRSKVAIQAEAMKKREERKEKQLNKKNKTIRVMKLTKENLERQEQLHPQQDPIKNCPTVYSIILSEQEKTPSEQKEIDDIKQAIIESQREQANYIPPASPQYSFQDLNIDRYPDIPDLDIPEIPSNIIVIDDDEEPEQINTAGQQQKSSSDEQNDNREADDVTMVEVLNPPCGDEPSGQFICDLMKSIHYTPPNKPGSWQKQLESGVAINDELIDGQVRLLYEMYPESTTDQYYINTMIMQMISKCAAESDMEAYQRIMQHVFIVDEQYAKNTNQILAPVHLILRDGSGHQVKHWVLLRVIIDRQRKYLHYSLFDSISGVYPELVGMIEILDAMIKTNFKLEGYVAIFDDRGASLKMKKTQANGTDCGIYVVYWIQRLLFDPTFDPTKTSPATIYSVRFSWASMIATFENWKHMIVPALAQFVIQCRMLGDCDTNTGYGNRRGLF